MCLRPRPTAAPRIICKRQNFPEVGLHQCPSERKGERGPVRSLHVPSHVPSPPQNAAKVRGFSRTASAFTSETDCLLEEARFEPLVPRSKGQPYRARRSLSRPAAILLIPRTTTSSSRHPDVVCRQ